MMRRSLTTVFVLALLLAAAGLALAGGTTANTGGVAIALAIGTTSNVQRSAYQSFQVSSGVVTQITVSVRTNVGSPSGTMTWAVWTDAGGTPGSLLGSGTFTPTVSATNTINITGGPFLSSATTYWLGFTPTSVQTNGNAWQLGASTNTYASGQLFGDTAHDVVFSLTTTDPTATPTPTATFTPSVTPTYTPSNTPTPTDTPTLTWTPSATPTETFTPSDTPTDTPTLTWTPSDTPTLTPSVTPLPGVTPTDTPTEAPSATVPASATPTATNTPGGPSDTPAPSATAIPSPTPTPLPDYCVEVTTPAGDAACVAREASIAQEAEIVLLLAIVVSLWLMFMSEEMGGR